MGRRGVGILAVKPGNAYFRLKSHGIFVSRILGTFLYRSKLKGSNTWLEYFGIYRLRSDCIFNIEGGFKIGTLSFRTFLPSVLL